MEEMHRVRYGERGQSFHAVSEETTLPKSPSVHTQNVLVFMEASLQSMIDWIIVHWQLNSISNLSPRRLRRG